MWPQCGHSSTFQALHQLEERHVVHEVMLGAEFPGHSLGTQEVHCALDLQEISKMKRASLQVVSRSRWHNPRCQDPIKTTKPAKRNMLTWSLVPLVRSPAHLGEEIPPKTAHLGPVQQRLHRRGVQAPQLLFLRDRYHKKPRSVSPGRG